MAPEIVRRVEYEGKPVDIWSLGILLYALLCGCFPFRAKAYPDLYRRIARGTFQIPEELSAPVKDLLRQLLTVDPEQRVNAHTALRHSWLQVQYVNAPNMDKLRQEMTILISEKPADDLDEQVLSELTAFGMGRDEVIRLVLTKTHSSLATLYYLLLDVVVSRRRAAGMAGKGKGVIALGTSAGGAATTNNKYVQQVRKTVAGATSSNGNSGSSAAGNFPNAILQNSNAGKMPLTSGPITVTQAVNEAAVLAQQQQQQQYNYDYSNAINGAGDRQEYRARPKSASQTRVSNITTLMNAGSTNSNTSNANNLAQAAAIIANGGATSNTGMPINTAGGVGGVPQQRPLSAYAVRR